MLNSQDASSFQTHAILKCELVHSLKSSWLFWSFIRKLNYLDQWKSLYTDLHFHNLFIFKQVEVNILKLFKYFLSAFLIWKFTAN